MTQLALAPAITLTDWQFQQQLCRQNPEQIVEISSTGVLIISPPSGLEKGHRES